MRSAWLTCLPVLLVAAAGAADDRLDLQTSPGGVTIGRATASPSVASPSPVRLFGREPRPDFAPLPPAPQPRAKPGPEGIDDTIFWRAINARDPAAARVEYDRLVATATPWPAQPTAAAVLKQASFDIDFAAAREAGDWSRVVALAADHPGQFVCDRVYNYWTLADAHVQRTAWDEAARLLGRVIADCGPADRQQALDRAADQLPQAFAARVFDRAGPAADTDAAAYRLTSRRIVAAFEAGDDATVLATATASADAIARRQDADLALFAAWAGERSGQHEAAALWFNNALTWQPSATAATGAVNAALRDGDIATAERLIDRHLAGTPTAAEAKARIADARVVARYEAGDDRGTVALAEQAQREGTATGNTALMAGLAQLRLDNPAAAIASFQAAGDAGIGAPATLGLARARLALGETEAAAALARAVLPDADAKALLGIIHIRRAAAAFADRDYETALVSARGAQSAPDLAIDALGLEGWSLFRLRRYRDAADVFEWLYRLDQTPDIADGLYESLTRAHQTGRLQRIADETGGPLARRVLWRGIAE